MHPLAFTKYSSFGNDFLILTQNNHGDAETKSSLALSSQQLAELARRYCDRHWGVGADGLLSWSRRQTEDATGDDPAWQLRIFNADGSEAAMCGNGLRAWASWWYMQCCKQRPLTPVHCRVTLAAGSFELICTADPSGSLMIDIGWPCCPVYHGAYAYYDNRYSVLKYTVEDWDSGVPHALIWAEQLPEDWVAISRQLAASHHYGPTSANRIAYTNVDWLIPLTNSDYTNYNDNDHDYPAINTITPNNHILIYTWEHGVGVTTACGTGSMAAAASWLAKQHRLHQLDNNLYTEYADLNQRPVIIHYPSANSTSLNLSASNFQSSPTMNSQNLQNLQNSPQVTIRQQTGQLWLGGQAALPICQGVLL